MNVVLEQCPVMRLFIYDVVETMTLQWQCTDNVIVKQEEEKNKEEVLREIDRGWCRSRRRRSLEEDMGENCVQARELWQNRAALRQPQF